MESEDLPTWVPEPVRKVAALYGTENPLVESFLSAPKMQGVWAYFQEHSVEPNFMDRIEHKPDLRRCALDNGSTPNSAQALACLFYIMWMAAANTNIIVYRKPIDEELEKLEKTIILVEALRNFAPDPVTPLPLNVDQTIKHIVAHCQRYLRMLDYSDKPFILKGQGKNDTVRTFVCKVGAATYGLYGEHSYGQLAIIANTTFKPTPPVTDKDAENWCKNLPLPKDEKNRRRGPIKIKST